MPWWNGILQAGEEIVRGELAWRREHPAEFASELLDRAETRIRLGRPGLAIIALRRVTRWITRCNPVDQKRLNARLAELHEKLEARS